MVFIDWISSSYYQAIQNFIIIMSHQKSHFQIKIHLDLHRLHLRVSFMSLLMLIVFIQQMVSILWLLSLI